MTDISVNRLEFLTIIADRDSKEDILDALLSSGCHLINIVYAKGALKRGYFKDMLGIVPEEKRVMVTCLVESRMCDRVLDMLIAKFNFNEPNTGIAFTVPVEGMAL